MHIVSTDTDGNTVDKYYRTNNAKLLTTNLDTIISTYEEVGILPEAYDACGLR